MIPQFRQLLPFQWLAKAIVDGEQVGLMLYKLEGGSVTNYTLRVSRFYSQTSQARYLLLGWIARHIDPFPKTARAQQDSLGRVAKVLQKLAARGATPLRVHRDPPLSQRPGNGVADRPQLVVRGK